MSEKLKSEWEKKSTDKQGYAYPGYIGVFDSGVGGLSVLKELTRELPEEDFLYYGDSANAPYGEKTLEEIRDLAIGVAYHLVESGAKAIVIACNTATSAAVKAIREKYSDRMPVIGIEPAIKPAAEANRNGKVLVMATPATLHLEKYEILSHKLEGMAEFIPVTCAGLAKRIEQGNLEAQDMIDLLEDLIGEYKGKVDGIVLGCTHYPFVKKAIRIVMGDVPTFDGGAGTARELKRQLIRHDLLKKEGSRGQIVLESSLDTPEEIELYRKLYAEL